MPFGGDVARLKKLTREVLIKEVLREFQGDFDGVVNAIDSWRQGNMDEKALDHYALNAGDCGCAICVSMHEQFARRVTPARPEPSDDWVAEILSTIDKLAPGMTATQLKHSLLCDRMFRGRTEDELIHFARAGYFLTHTPDQAEAERRLKEWREARKLRAHAP